MIFIKIGVLNLQRCKSVNEYIKLNPSIEHHQLKEYICLFEKILNMIKDCSKEQTLHEFFKLQPMKNKNDCEKNFILFNFISKLIILFRSNKKKYFNEKSIYFLDKLYNLFYCMKKLTKIIKK